LPASPVLLTIVSPRPSCIIVIPVVSEIPDKVQQITCLPARTLPGIHYQLDKHGRYLLQAGLTFHCGRLGVMQLNNRITDAWIDDSEVAVSASVARPQPAFVLCPVGVAAWQQRLYQVAFEQAAANLRSAVMERICKVVWN
jgi:hypothetical protein